MTPQDLATLTIVMLVADLQYEEKPVYGHAPIRHLMAWNNAAEILGEADTQQLVNKIKEDLKIGRQETVNVNPMRWRWEGNH